LICVPRLRLGTCLASLATVVTWGCASQGLPPGGPPDKSPPVLVKVTPDSGALRVGLRQTVTFQFDEVVGERTKSGVALDQGVVVSPSDGPVSVDWHRTYITIRNKKGWRPDLAYTVTILSGLMDLNGNAIRKPLQTVFSTGTVIPHGEVRGVAFDWAAQQIVSGARVEAMIGNDTALKFLAVADSTGRFVLATLPAGTLKLRAYVDQNQNRVLDPRELWDSSSVALTDSARREFYMFAHDSIGPSLSDVSAIDSMTLRVRFDRPVSPGAPLDIAQFSLKVKDSTKTDSVPILLKRISSAARFDTLQQTRKLFVLDSTMRADTSEAGRKAVQRQDSLKRAAAIDSISRAQDAAANASRHGIVPKVENPKPSRPAPLSEFILELAQPLPYDMFATLSAKDVLGLTGHTHKPPRVKQFVLRKPKPPAKDSTAAPVKKP